MRLQIYIAVKEMEEYTLSPAEEWIADICINEATGVWKSVELTAETTVQDVFDKLRKMGVKTTGMCLTTENHELVNSQI